MQFHIRIQHRPGRNTEITNSLSPVFAEETGNALIDDCLTKYIFIHSSAIFWEKAAQKRYFATLKNISTIFSLPPRHKASYRSKKTVCSCEYVKPSIQKSGKQRTDKTISTGRSYATYPFEKTIYMLYFTTPGSGLNDPKVFDSAALETTSLTTLSN